MKNMLDMGWITQAEYDARKYPAVKQADHELLQDLRGGQAGRHDPAARHGRACTTAASARRRVRPGRSDDHHDDRPGRAEGGRGSAARARARTRRCTVDPTTYQAAVIGIDPNTGRVLGYYGGDNPTGIDYAGYMPGDGIADHRWSVTRLELQDLHAGRRPQGGPVLRQHLGLPRCSGTNGTKINNAGADDNALCGGRHSSTVTSRRRRSSRTTSRSTGSPTRSAGTRSSQAAKAAGLKHMYQNGNQSERRSTSPRPTPRTWKKSATSTTRSASASTGSSRWSTPRASRRSSTAVCTTPRTSSSR